MKIKRHTYAVIASVISYYSLPSFLAEGAGFEPARALLGTPAVFKTAAFNHSAIPPKSKTRYAVLAYATSRLVGAGGFEPPIRDPKSRALPLGHTPLCI